ncbi:MAG: transposase [Legionella sp.]|uniref:transposase n=1 Tax=Legionella sp. TaxID=459 RepID=UPI0039E7269E
MDESGMNDNDFYPHAYSAISTRHYEAHPRHYIRRISMIGGLSSQNFIAPFIFDGHCNTVVFELYVEQVLAPVLSKDILVGIDYASFHKSVKIRNLIEATGAKLLYLPALFS